MQEFVTKSFRTVQFHTGQTTCYVISTSMVTDSRQVQETSTKTFHSTKNWLPQASVSLQQFCRHNFAQESKLFDSSTELKWFDLNLRPNAF